VAPDLVIEIASSTQARPDLGDKALHWLDRGVQVVWVAGPNQQEIDVWTPGAQEPRTLAGQDELTGGDIIPGLSVTVASMW
jgi:Uma2 family endonuclease